MIIQHALSALHEGNPTMNKSGNNHSRRKTYPLSANNIPSLIFKTKQLSNRDFNVRK